MAGLVLASGCRFHSGLTREALDLLGPVGFPGLVLLMVLAEAQGHRPTEPVSVYIMFANIPLAKATLMAKCKVKGVSM